MVDLSSPGIYFIRSLVRVPDAGGAPKMMQYEATMRWDGNKWHCDAFDIVLVNM